MPAPLPSRQPTSSTLYTLLNCCCSHLPHLRQIHSLLLTTGLSLSSHPLLFKLIRSLTLHFSDQLPYARLVFDSVPSPNVFLYTAMITAYAQQNTSSDAAAAFLLYARMHRSGKNSARPNQFTFPYVLRSCATVNSPFRARQTHAHVLKSGFYEGYGVVQTSLVDAMAKCGEIQAARQVFDEITDRNEVSWTAMIYGYLRFGNVVQAVGLFDEMPVKDLPAWNAVIAGLAQNGMFDEAVELFLTMVGQEGHRPNETTLVSALSACGQSGKLLLGCLIHGYVYKSMTGVSCYVGNALVDMYGKCGSLVESRRVFHEMFDRNVSSWNSLINGFALHGRAMEAIAVFDEMVSSSNFTPDRITFVGLLNACVHGGLVDEGWSYFCSMSRDYAIHPQIEHYGCVVDLYGRAGRFKEMIEVVRSMDDVEPDEAIWGAVLNACKMYGNTELAEFAVRRLAELNPHNAASYLVVLANLYGKAGMWEEAGKARMLIKDRGCKKTPGCSWIEVNDEVHQFFSADKLHEEVEGIYETLDSLLAASEVVDDEIAW